MRGPGESSYDPTRPTTKSVSGTAIQTTLIVPSQLAQVPLRLEGNRVAVPEDFVRALDGDGMVTLLCAVVTQSGWRWQPVFMGGGSGD